MCATGKPDPWLLRIVQVIDEENAVFNPLSASPTKGSNRLTANCRLIV